MVRRVLAVGNCGFDDSSLRRLIEGELGAEMTSVDSSAEAVAAAAGSFSLILINRVLDRTGESGVDLVRTLKAEAAAETPVMLISNFADAQRQAVQAGAEPGFGKNQLGDPAVRERLADVLSPEAASDS